MVSLLQLMRNIIDSRLLRGLICLFEDTNTCERLTDGTKFNPPLWFTMGEVTGLYARSFICENANYMITEPTLSDGERKHQSRQWRDRIVYSGMRYQAQQDYRQSGGHTWLPKRPGVVHQQVLYEMSRVNNTHRDEVSSVSVFEWHTTWVQYQQSKHP